jgi:hypothetical protein
MNILDMVDVPARNTPDQQVQLALLVVMQIGASVLSRHEFDVAVKHCLEEVLHESPYDLVSPTDTSTTI